MELVSVNHIGVAPPSAAYFIASGYNILRSPIAPDSRIHYNDLIM